MADLLSGGVTRGLVGASVYMDNAKVCMAVYTAAKASGDEATMERALGYASDSMGSAKDAAEESKTALAENIKTVREEEKAEQAARLEKARQEAEENRAETQTNTNGESTAKIVEPTDIIEISPEALAALQNETDTEEQTESTTDYITGAVKQKETPLFEKHPRLNTQTADIKIKHGKIDIKL